MVRQVIDHPPGFRFKPKDEELINFYLKPKVMGQQLPCNIINDDIQLYAPHSTPWLLFDIENPDSWDHDNSLYVFTSLSKVSTDPNFTCTKSRCNTNKKAGCGTWVQKTSRVDIRDCDGNVIGGRRMLVFQVNEIPDGFDDSKAVYFRMHEYSLWGVNEGLGSDACDLVLCKITFDVSKKSPFKLLTKKTDHVSTSGSKAQKIKQNTKNLEGSSGLTLKSVTVMNESDVLEGSTSFNSENLINTKNLEGSSGSTLKSVTVMNDSDVLEGSTSLNSENLVAIDGGVRNEDWSATAPYDISLEDLDEFCAGLSFDDISCEDLCFDGLGGEDISEPFDIDGLEQYLNSTPEEELLEDRTIRSLGKRKSIEGDNSCPAKKVCF